VETRTSAPVQIVRDPVTLQSVSLKGLYPAGEGAGHAGGIISAAVDGSRIGRMLVSEILGKIDYLQDVTNTALINSNEI
jgi:hypothetical protein